jgi:hypothetical protein
MNIERVPISKVVPWDKNPRGIKTKDFDRLKKQILKLGDYKPLIAYKENGHYVVLGGNMRIRAYKELGLQEVNVSVVDAPTEAKKIEYALSDNDRVGYYEEEALAELVYPHIKDIDLSEFKVDIGEPIDLKQVVERYGPDIDDGADEVPEVDDTPAVTKTGDLFTLGRHRVMCGDSTKAEDVARLMRGKKADLCLADPPYGIGGTVSKKNKYSLYDDTKENLIKVIGGFLPLAQTISQLTVLTPGNGNVRLYPNETWMMAWFMAAGSGRGPWGFCCWQPILCYGADPKLKNGLGCHPDAVGGLAQMEQLDHPCAKPMKFWGWLMERVSADGQLVYDPFLGSGTTLIAAEKLNRTCYGMEIDPKYCDVIIKRYCDYAHVDEAVVRATRENPVG